MPNTHSTLTALFGAIASAIRAKTGTSASIVADAFPSAISNIPDDRLPLYAQSGISEFIDSNITEIRDFAFQGQLGLQNVECENVQTIGAGAFGVDTQILLFWSAIGYPSAKLTTASFPNATTIKSYAFYGDANLSSLYIPNVISLGQEVFAGTKISTLNLPNITSLPEKAFAFCSYLTEISIPQISILTNNCFASCYSLSQISLPQISQIESSTFYRCSSLTDVYLPNITELPKQAFAYCSSLSSVTFQNVTEIKSSVFYSCSNLQYLNFPNMLQISQSTFANMPSIKELHASQVSIIGSSAFYYCNRLNTIDFPEATTIQQGAFMYCPSLTTISFSKLTFLESCAFSHCTNLSQFNLPNISQIEESTFAECGFETISTSIIESIKDYAFYSCSKLLNISFDNLIFVGAWAFANCRSLNTVSLPKCRILEGYAFSSCNSLSSIVLPNIYYIAIRPWPTNIQTIDLGGFSESYSNYTKGFHPSAFANYRSMCSLYLRADHVVPLTGSGVFYNTQIAGSAITGTYGSIYVPASLVTEYQNATNWTYFSSRITAI